MSSRDDRDSESIRRRSRFDRQSSPKRSRRDETVEAKRSNPGSGDRAEQNKKQRRCLQDALPLETRLGPDNKSDKKTSSKEATKKGYGGSEGAKRSSDPSEVPRSRSFSQDDERNHAVQGDLRPSLGTTSERGWWKDNRVQHGGKESKKKSRSDDSRRGERSNRGEHGGFLEMEVNPPPPPPPLSSKRPSFREQKNHNDCQSKREASKHKSARKERYGGGGGNRFRGREESYNNTRRQQQQQTHYNSRMPGGVQKWRHDRFDQANRIPTPKNDESRLAKIEALLAS